MKKIILGLFSVLITVGIIYLAWALYLLSSSKDEALLATMEIGIYKIPITSIAQQYVKYTIDPNSENELGMPYFHFILAGYSREDSQEAKIVNANIFKIADIFIENGAKIDELIDKRSGFNALHSAILLRDFEVVKYLISKGADISVTTKRMEDSTMIKEISGLNAIELANFLYNRNQDKSYKNIANYLRSVQSQ